MRLTRSGPSRRAANRSGVQHPTANCGNSVFIASLHQLVSCIVTHHTHHTTQLKQPGTQQLYNPLPRTGHHQHQWLSEPRLLAQPLALRSLRPGLGRLAPALKPTPKSPKAPKFSEARSTPAAKPTGPTVTKFRITTKSPKSPKACN